jgi:hypothetical protein
VLVGWGADPAQATAGVVLFSLYTHFFEVPLGVLGWVLWLVSPKKEPADGADNGHDDHGDHEGDDSVKVGVGRGLSRRGPRPEVP